MCFSLILKYKQIIVHWLFLFERAKHMPMPVCHRNELLAGYCQVSFVQFFLMDMAHGTVVQSYLGHGGSEPCFKSPKSTETFFSLR